MTSTQLDATMEGLVRLGNNSKILPGIAKSWKESKDGMTWTFNLRKNAKWSNGEALPARPPADLRGTEGKQIRKDFYLFWVKVFFAYSTWLIRKSLQHRWPGFFPVQLG